MAVNVEIQVPEVKWTNAAPLDLGNEVIFQGVTTQGIYGRRMYETCVQMTVLLSSGGLHLKP
jgi:hypothetical protein